MGRGMRDPPSAFEQIATRHRAEIAAYLGRLLGHDQDAQDLCQETFLRAQRAFPRLPAGANTRAWLYRIATNRAWSALACRARMAARTAELDLDTLPGRDGTSPETRERLRLVARAVGALPPKQRAALIQRRFEGLEYAEIGAALACSAASARANVYQALKKLRAALAIPGEIDEER